MSMQTSQSNVRPLYAIEGELEKLMAALASEDFSEEEKNEAVDAWLDRNQAEIAQKIDGYCAVIANNLSLAEARKKEARALSDMARADEAVATRLKERAVGFFERAGIERMETLHFKPRIQENGGVQSVVLTVPEEDISLLPEAYTDTVVVADMQAIRDALEAGVELPFAKLLPRGKHFRLR